MWTVWGRVKDGLKGSRLSNKWKAGIVEATDFSSLLYDCQVRVWWARGEIKEARKELKRFLKRLEREWWRGVIEECECQG